MRFKVWIDDHRYVHVVDEDFGYDASFEISGDFPTENERIAYAEAVAMALNSAEIPRA